MSLIEETSEPNLTSTDPLLHALSLTEENLTKQSNWITRFSGILYSLLSSFIFVSGTFTIKLLGVDLLDALLVRFFVQTIIVLSFVLNKHYTLLGGTIWQICLQIICSGTGALGFVLFCLAVRYIELSDINTLSYTRVVWTVVLSVIVYRERPSTGTLIALPLTLLGVIFVTQPNFLFTSKPTLVKNIDDKFRILGYAMALGAALTSAINVLLFKQLISASTDIKTSVLNFQFALAMLVILILNQFYKIFYIQITISWISFLSWRFLLAAIVCVLTISAGIFTQKSIKREHPAVYSLLGSADIIFALLLQNIFTSVQSNFYALIGSALVICSVVILGISRIINERNIQKKIKQNVNKNNEIC
ncbi:unnamed protein product [Adineta steineri]|uniref:EamA domain-containing protein n=1 Tax=Adineta steineri TaxID=433720 RepID=A0A815DUC5_9BILA|nr:unnamed protein product [Adineta steineri]